MAPYGERQQSTIKLKIVLNELQLFHDIYVDYIISLCRKFQIIIFIFIVDVVGCWCCRPNSTAIEH